MQTITVQVQPDHLQRISAHKSPIDGIIELIWNSFDAEASVVEVYFARNELGGIESVHIRDNGHGIYYPEAFDVFRKLGGSWKNKRRFSANKHRFLHGCEGQGRFAAFSIGKSVNWHTHYTENERYYHYKILSNDELMLTFELSEPEEIPSPHFGTEVSITELNHAGHSITGEYVITRLTEEFAVYLRKYPTLQLIFDGELICADQLETEVSEYFLDSPDGLPETKVMIIEWNHNCGSRIYLCNTQGHTLEQIDSPLKLPGFNYTVHIHSPLIEQLEDDGLLLLNQMNPSLLNFMDDVYNLLNYHFEKQSENRKRQLIQSWKEEGLYPFYDAQPGDTENRQHMQLFDHYAGNLLFNLPGFNDASKGHKMLTLDLIKKLIKSDPESIRELI